MPIMKRIRARGEDIRRFVLEHVEKHPNDVSKVAAEHFKITRQGINKHLQRLVKEHSLEEKGATRNRIYNLAPLLEWRQTYAITSALEEHIVWEKDISLLVGSQPENVIDIWRYGFTEMFNNARDHSGGTWIHLYVAKTAVDMQMYIMDDGVGIFNKIQQALNLPDERYAILELSKGKLTTDPTRHTGEGIFFTSRMFDMFGISSRQVYFGHRFGQKEDWILKDGTSIDGTTVMMRVSNHTSRTVTKIWDQYTEDFGFTKTVVPIRLAQYGNDKLISRSQAKRVLARMEVFKVVMLDFTEVPTIGQAFADEIFRVFPLEHPNVELIPVHANSEVKRMIERAKSNEVPPI
jgi:anti-sigma regulatory factor (Ser/Thr protein kinase)